MAAARRAYTYATAMQDFSASRAELDRLVQTGRIRVRKVERGRDRLDPDDLEREFGFASNAQALRTPTPAARAVARDLVS